MLILKQEYNDRKNEIDNFFELLFKVEKENASLILENENVYRISLQTNTYIKSSCIIVLYNLVESIVTQSLNKIHGHIYANNIQFSDLNNEIQKLLISYYHKAIAQNRSDDRVMVDYLHEFLLLNLSNESFGLTYDTMTKFYSLYSGNLDARKIRKVLKNYGISYDNPLSELKTIKDKRNELAHGEKSFEECGRSMTYEQLDTLKEKAYEYLDGMIQSIELYLNSRNYIAANQGETQAG